MKSSQDQINIAKTDIKNYIKDIMKEMENKLTQEIKELVKKKIEWIVLKEWANHAFLN